LVDRYGLGSEDARVIADFPVLAKLLTDALTRSNNARSVASWIVNELPSETREGKPLPFGGAELGELVSLVDAGTITGASAKRVLGEMLLKGGSPARIVEQQGLTQIADAGALDPVITSVLSESGDAVARYKAGNKNVLGALVGAVMRRTRGQANPKLVGEMIAKKLGAP
jgi:glutaminyl-tRNA synthetase